MNQLNTSVHGLNDVRRALEQIGHIPYGAYTVSWTGSVTNPAIGNGTLTGYYAAFMGFCFVNVRMFAGSTTTFGSGDWRFSLPIPMNGSHHTFGPANLLDSGTARVPATARISSNVKTSVLLLSTTVVNATVPFTWTINDELVFSIWYPI